MPEIDIFNKDGSLRYDAPARLLATMYFPAEKKLRNQFIGGIIRPIIRRRILRSTERITIARPLALTCINGLELDEIGVDERNIIRDGIISAHWLQFRVIANAKTPEANSTRKWESYFLKEISPRLNSESNVRWPTSASQLHKARSHFSSVSHIWAACIFGNHYDIDTNDLRRHPFRIRGLLLGEGYILPNKLMPIIARADEYRKVAASANIYQNLDNLWTTSQLVDQQQTKLHSSLPTSMSPEFDAVQFCENYASRFFRSIYGDDATPRSRRRS